MPPPAPTVCLQDLYEQLLKRVLSAKSIQIHCRLPERRRLKILYFFHVAQSVWLCVCTAQCKANCTGVSCKISVVMSTVYVGCHAPVEPHLIGCCTQPCFKPVKCTKASYAVSVSSRRQA